MSPTSYRIALPRDILLRLICPISRKLLYRGYRVLSTVFYNFFNIFLKVILIKHLSPIHYSILRIFIIHSIFSLPILSSISFCAVCQADIASSIKLDSLCYGILLNLRCHKTVLCIPVFPIDGNFVHIPRFYTFDNKFPIIILFHSHILR